MEYASPLRYPGGKACLSGLLERTIDLNGLREASYYEPYAGGAGAALNLLVEGVVSNIFINDADTRVSAFWQSAVNHSQRFSDRILNTLVTIDEWRVQQSVCLNPRGHDKFDVGFAAFFMNRCNRSGVLSGAGPIGGYSQAGSWRIDVRFNKENLAKRILKIGTLSKQIHVSNKDAISFLKSMLPRGGGRKKVFVYLDPPYVNKGQRLYLNSYESKDHACLAKYLQQQNTLPWVMSYDDTKLIRDLYKEQQIQSLSIRYALHEKRLASELIIAPCRMKLPEA